MTDPRGSIPPPLPPRPDEWARFSPLTKLKIVWIVFWCTLNMQLAIFGLHIGGLLHPIKKEHKHMSKKHTPMPWIKLPTSMLLDPIITDLSPYLAWQYIKLYLYAGFLNEHGTLISDDIPLGPDHLDSAVLHCDPYNDEWTATKVIMALWGSCLLTIEDDSGQEQKMKGLENPPDFGNCVIKITYWEDEQGETTEKATS